MAFVPPNETPIVSLPVTENPPRSGTSPIGTSSPNSGAYANTNSTYGQGAFTSGIAELGTATTYTVQNTDYQGIVQFDTASAVTVTLNARVRTNFTCDILNFNSGAITLTTSDGSSINNGGSSLTLASMQGVTIYFANGAWTAFIGSTVIPTVPSTIAPVTGEYLTGYNATTGLFSQSSPAGISVTIVTAKLTTGGTNGSMTFTNGLLTAQTPAT